MIIKFNEDEILTISNNIKNFYWSDKVLSAEEIKELYLRGIEQ